MNNILNQPVKINNIEGLGRYKDSSTLQHLVNKVIKSNFNKIEVQYINIFGIDFKDIIKLSNKADLKQIFGTGDYNAIMMQSKQYQFNSNSAKGKIINLFNIA